MKVRPTPLVSILLFLAYVALIGLVWAVVGLDYDQVGDSTTTVVQGVVVPVGLGAVLLAVAASVLGWWRPALREPARAGRPWMLVVGLLLVVIAGGNLVVTDWGALEVSFLVVLAVGTALVGFSEEMLTRGLAIVGFRGTMREPAVWFASSLMFGLLHVLNLAFGQSLGGTARQVVFAFLTGTAFYVVRRVSGLLVVTMAIHALWDFSVFAQDSSGAEPNVVTGVLLWPALIVAFVALVLLLRARPATATPPAPRAAAA